MPCGLIDFTADRKSNDGSDIDTRAREFINNREKSRRARLLADNGRPRVFAALITVSNVERGKKDGDECAAELVTDGGSRDPLCQPRAHHRETARIILKQQSAHIRDTLFAAALSIVQKNSEILMPLDLSNSCPAACGRRSKSRQRMQI